jgi:S-adenosylmethionine-dependent methyltransferase
MEAGMGNSVEEYYNGQSETEWARLERHRLEFEITKRALDESIKPGSRVLDAGGGPGRYSIHLAGRGCRVTLLDLSLQNVLKAQAEAQRAGVSLEAAYHGNALDIGEILKGQLFDAVLCMGPIYHLHSEADRVSVINQCMAVLKPGGVFVAAFISAYAPTLDILRKYPGTVANNVGKYLGYLTDGRNLAADGFTDAWFTHPCDVEPFMARFPLEKIVLLAAEGLGILVEPALTALPEEQFLQWIDLFYNIAVNPETHGACEHLLYIGRKKSD